MAPTTAARVTGAARQRPRSSPTAWRADLSRPAPPMGYVPGLDGVRALAVMAVVLYHGSSPWLPGGFLGVDVFFVLSGFLISTLLFQQLQSKDRINFKKFYLGRARRLLPALIAALALSAVLVATVARDVAAQFRDNLLESLFFVVNWSFIFGDQSYFEAVGRPSVLQHLWSLAVEEQFYLLWPLVLLALFRWRGRAGVGRVALIVALASTLLMAVLSVAWNVPGGGDASRLYMGTDTHCMSLLVGAALAAVWRPGALPRRLPPQRAAALTAVGVGATAVVLLSFAVMSQSSNLLYRGGFLVVAIATAVMIAVITHPAASLGAVMALRPLRWIGVRSYGIYLYHWPIFVVTRPGLDIPLTGVAAFAFSLTLTLVVADLSYRYLEMPVRRGAIGRTWQRWRQQGVLQDRLVRIVPASAAAVLVVGFAVAAVPAVDADDYLGGRTEVNAAPLAAGSVADQVVAAQAAAAAAAAAAANAAPEPVTASDPITVVGDSVTVGTADQLAAQLSAVTVDGAVNRQPQEVFNRVVERRAAKQLDDVLVVQTGTNGQVTDENLRGLLEQTQDLRRVVLVTSAGTLPWIGASNDTIRNVAPEFANVRVADWAALAGGQPDLLFTDGVHPSEAGKQAYATLLTQALLGP